MKHIEIYDTTLRDGAQMRDISFSVADKLKILTILDDLGVDYVEGGWPGANPKDEDFFVEAAKLKLKHTKLVAFGSTRKAGSRVETDTILQALLRAGTQSLCIVGKSAAYQVLNTMKISLEENLQILEESISYLKSNDREVFIDAEHFFDGFKDNPVYAKDFIRTAIRAGADRMVLCDTNGGSLPEDVFQISKELVEEFGEEIKFGIHAHNDGELAVANSIRAVRAGIVQVQGTINGYGERCGNANLISIIPNLQLKVGPVKLQCLDTQNLAKLSSVARKIAEIANMNLNSSQPFVGTRAFTHKGGLHASAIQKDKSSYEHIDPSLVGNRTRIVISEQSGLSNILDWFRNNGFDFLEEAAARELGQVLLAKLKNLEHRGYSFENAEASFDLLVRKTLVQDHRDLIPESKSPEEIYPEFFSLIESNVHIVNGEKTEASVRLEINGEERHSVSLGNGPANALDRALRKALVDYYPEIEKIHLFDFKVRILDGHLGTGSITKVQISTGFNDPSVSATNNQWNTIGLGSNIIKASWDALVDSIQYALIQSRTSSIKDIVCDA